MRKEAVDDIASSTSSRLWPPGFHPLSSFYSLAKYVSLKHSGVTEPLVSLKVSYMRPCLPLPPQPFPLLHLPCITVYTVSLSGREQSFHFM